MTGRISFPIPREIWTLTLAERTSEKQPTNLQTYLVSREHVPSIGTETDSGQRYLSFPTGNRLMDYEEYYRTDAGDSTRYFCDMGSALGFAKRYRRRQMDHLLLVAPGNDRGSAL